MFSSSLSVSNTNSTELLSVCRFVCLPLRPPVFLSAGRFRKPSPAPHGTGPSSPSVSPCRDVPGEATSTRRREESGEKRGEKEEKGERRERKRYSPSSTRPLLGSLSLSPSLSVDVPLPEPLPPAASARWHQDERDEHERFLPSLSK